MTVTFVAEVSSNHNRDLNRCLAFIDTAAEIGCAAVKFQLFNIKELFAPEILAQSETHRQRKAWELPVEFLPTLAARCHEAGMQFACTPFYIDAVEELFPYVDFYKIASYELLWDDLLIACARTGKPVVLSTGMATLDEVQQAVKVLCENGCQDLTVLHCISGYPTPVSECNLSAIETLRTAIRNPSAALRAGPQSFGRVYSEQSRTSQDKSAIRIRFGWSDHSVNPGVVYRAVHRWGATMVEFHLDLEGEGEEYRSGHCWLPEQIQPVIEAVTVGWLADGTGEKVPAPSELPDREWRADPADGLRPLMKVREAWRA